MLSSLFILLRSALGPSSVSTALPTHVKRLDVAGDILSLELTLATRLASGDEVLCVHGDIVPRDGEVVDGTAIVTDAESQDAAAAPLRCVAAGTRIRAGTRVRANHIIVRVGVTRSRVT